MSTPTLLAQDKNSDDREKAGEKFKSISEAYDVSLPMDGSLTSVV